MKKLSIILYLIMYSLLMKNGETFPQIQTEAFKFLTDSGKIVFSINEKDIYTMNEDGTGFQKITHHPGNHTGPAWSPSGEKIAFYDQINNNSASEYIMNADGSNIKRLTFDTNVIDSPPCWTSDGKIIFAREYPLVNSKTEIWMVDSSGSNLHKIVEDGSYPDCSYDGTKIVYPVYSDGDGEIWINNIEGTDPVKITDNQSQEWLPAWSPVTDQIVFQSDRDGNHEIYIMNIDGSNIRRLTNNSFYDGYPRWSPDGSQIVFESLRDGHYEIYKMDTTGLNQERLTVTNGNAFQPDWGTISITGIDDQEITKQLPKSFRLFQNYPNPFNPNTKIKYSIPGKSFVSLKVFGLLANEITTLVNEEKSAGNYEVQFNGLELPSGVYFYKLQTDDFIQTKKMILLK